MLNADIIVIHCDFASRDLFEIALTLSTKLKSKEENMTQKSNKRHCQNCENERKMTRYCCMYVKKFLKEIANIDVVSKIQYCCQNEIFNCLNF